MTTKTFADFGVDAQLCDALAEADIIHPFPIQELTLPLALAGADIIGQARTGTGKTLGFGIPLLQKVDLADDRTQALVIVPTRELCLQVASDLTQAGARKGVKVVAAYGGKAIDPQAAAIAAGAPIVVGTPGRLLDLCRRGTLDLSTATGLVLDEADEMLDLGFLPDVEQLIERTADGRQTLLFSATMPSQVVALARRYMHKPTFLRADVEEVRIAPDTKQHFFSCHRMDKPAVLARILQAPDRGRCLVFSRTKRMADILSEELRERGVKAAPIHSDLRQDARERALARFRAGTVDVLIATEVAARGLDITDVTHVVNYDCPDDEKMYLHRIGRTGRAGAAGVAITLALWNELARLDMIRKALDIEDEVHEVFSTSPMLDELFSLPPREPRAPRARAQRDADESASGPPQARRGSRGRGRAKTAAAERPPAPQRRPSRDEAAAEGQPAARTRVRHRGSRTDAQDRPEAPATTAAADDNGRRAGSREAAADRGAPLGDGGGDERRTRTRVRRRAGGSDTAHTSAGGALADEATAPRSDTDEQPPADRVGRSRRSGGSEDREPARDRKSRGGRRGRDDEPARTRVTRGDRGRSSAGRDRRGRPDARGATRSRRPQVDTATARGDGKPGLVRKLVIDHLP